MSSRRNPGVRINIFFFCLCSGYFFSLFWSEFSLRLIWAVNKASHTFSASALAAEELCKNCPLSTMLKKGVGRLEPEGTTSSSNIAYTAWVQSVEKGGSDAEWTTLLLGSTSLRSHRTWAWLYREQLCKAAWFCEAIFKPLMYWRGDTSIRHPN